MKLWGGRFQKGTDKSVDDFNSSIHFDERMYKEDILGSIAHAKMLAKQGIINKNAAENIQKGLLQILEDIENGAAEFTMEAEDIHMNIETLLIEKIGEDGKCLHTARSRNDQVALDIRMYLLKEAKSIKKNLTRLLKVLITIAQDNTGTIMPGYTHLQKAQPITLAHYLMAYFEMFKRDIERLCDFLKRTNILPLGSGALAGTTYNTDRHFIKDELDFFEVSRNSLDSVSDRDFVIELLSCLSLIMMHLSRFSEEIVIYNSNEFSFLEIDDAFSTGSSIMPQKKNPDVAELVRGKTGRVYGDLMAVLTVMKGLPLAYNKDMQEDKEAVFDAVDTVKMCIPVFTDMINTLKFNKENMYKGAGFGYTNATDAADYLVKKGMPFRNAHEIIGKIIFYAIKQRKALEEITLDEYKNFSPLFEEDIYNAINLETCVNMRKSKGGPAPEAVKEHICFAEEFISNIESGIL